MTKLLNESTKKALIPQKSSLAKRTIIILFHLLLYDFV